jgi:hypothetical protein
VLVLGRVGLIQVLGAMKTYKAANGSYFLIRMASMSVGIGMCFVSSCSNDPVPIASAESKSPNGNWAATASTIQNAGFGTGDVETGVYLKWVSSPHPPTLILGFSNESAYPPGITSVHMNWLTNSHLDVTYKIGATLNFQAIKAGGVEITAHQLDVKHQ